MLDSDSGVMILYGFTVPSKHTLIDICICLLQEVKRIQAALQR